jgi:CPA1 family monovalent cation:H+ antiporter
VPADLPVIVALLVAAIALAIAAKRVRVPYSVALVVGGMLLAMAGVLPDVPHMDPQVVLWICLPLLLFEGGIAADLASIRANWVVISVLATAGMIASIAVTGSLLTASLALAWGPALLLGAILSVTDTVSVLYAFRRLALPARLSAVIKGESLFNDGTALVAYAALATVALGGGVSVPALGGQVLLSTLGGLAVGLALGLAGAFVIRRMQDPLAEVMATTALAFASFTAAQWVGVSGAVAAVTCGLAVGAALRRAASPQSRIALNTFWDYVAFGVNTFLFMSVGLSTSPQSLWAHLPQTLVAVGCVVLGRAAGIYLPFVLLRLLRKADSMPLRWQHVFIVGNIKGALSIALVLGLPAELPERALLVNTAFGVTFLSLVVQGAGLTRALAWLGLTRSDPLAETVGEQRARLISARAAQAELEQLHHAGMVSRDGYDHLRSEYQVQVAGAEREVRRLHEMNLAQGARLLLSTRRRLLDAERNAVMEARSAGLVPEESAEKLLGQIDARLVDVEALLGEEGPVAGAGRRA